MRKQVKSFWSKRILAILLSMLVLATAVPIGTFLALALDYGEVTVLTLADEVVVNEDDPTQVTVAYAPESTVTLEKDGQNGWQAQLRITAPASMEATLSAAVYQEKFGTGEWQEDAETLPFQADPVAEANTSLVLSASMDAELLQSNETLCYAWRFDWDGDTVYDQTVTYTIDASRVVLMEGGEQIYPVYGTVQAITNADAASVTADSTMPAVDKTTISYAERLELSQTAEGTPWLVQIRVTAPLGFDAEKLASAQYQSSPAGSENWSAAGSFLTNAQAGADGTYALDLNAEIASAALEEQSNVGTQWQFDWDGDGAYEQLVVLNLDPARLTLKDAGGAQVWPKAEATLTIDPADADAAGGQVTATATLHEVGAIQAVWDKNAQTLTLSIAETCGYHFASVSVNGTVQEISNLTDSSPVTVVLSNQMYEETATIAVGFKINSYALSVTETGSSDVAGNTAAFAVSSAEHGTTATLSLSCAKGYKAIDVNGVFGEANGVIADGTNEAVTNSSLTTKNTITGPLTAEIRFDPVEYTISYHTPVGTAPANSIYTVETETVVLPEMANLDGFAFSGWATLDEKNTVAAEGLVESFDPTQATNIDLYAVWDVETAVSAKTGDGETVSSNSWTTASTVNLTFASELNADSLTYTYAVGETEETLAASDAITSEGSTEATYTVQQAAFTDADGVHYIYETISDSDQSTAPTFVLLQDSVAPTASMKVATANSPIEKFLTTITFGLLSFKETTEATVSVSDSVSGLSKVEYLEMEYPQAAYGEQTNTFQLDEVAASQGWQAVSGFQNGADTAEVSVEIKAKENKNIILFVRTTDVAGNVSYICSDGVIVDITPPTGVLQPQGYTSELTDDELDNKKPIYGKAQVEKTDSILINVEVTEEALQEEGASTAILQSGIATITYSTQVKNRADDEYRYIEKDESLYTHQGDIQTDIRRTITLKNVSQDYNYNYVLITLDVTDLAGNSATYTREIAVDLTAPTVTVRYAPLEPTSGSMYNETRVATFTYTERTENWDKEDAEERLRNLIHAANLEHDPLEDAYTLGEWVNVAGTTPDEDTHSIEVIFNDANYTIQDKSGENYVNAEACVDKAGNITETIAAADETVENPFRFTVDTAAPYELGLAYTSETDIRDVVLNGITFGFWQNAEGADASVTATLTAHDVTSGVKQFVVTIETDGAESATTADMPADADLNQAGRQFVIGTEPVEQDAEGAVTYTNIVADTADPTLYTATVKLPAQFRGKLSFEAVDYAANKTEFNGDVQSSDGAYPKNDYVAVVDNTNPQLMIHYGNNGRYVDQGSLVDQIESENTIAYYQQDAKVELTFTDANFDLGGEDRTEIQVFKDGQAYTEADIVWSDFAKTTAQQTATLTLSEDGDYQISVSYVDYSGNLLEVEREEGSAYAVETAAGTFMTTNIITVDKTAPEIEEITITPNEVVSALEGRAYYDVPQTVTITVREHNFCIGRILNAAAFADFIIPGEDAQSELVAANVSSERLSEIEQDLIDQIRDEENWTSDGDLHTVTLQFQSDANYTINFKPIDLAGNVLVNKQLQTFTVDVTDPEILGIDYEQQVFGTIISGLTFGYYNAQVEATVTAEDDTAGVYRFEYEGLLADGVSEKNQAVLQTAIQEADITQLSDAAGNATNRFEASFRIPREVLTELNSFNGTVTVTAYDRSENTMTFADDERLVVDRIAPTCLVTFNQEVETVNNVSYYDVPVTATVQINEANFYAEDVNILVNGSRVEPSDWTQNGDVWTATVTMAQEGDYVFSVEYTDRSGNQMQTYTSNQKTVDLTAPSIRVQNVRHESANNAETVGFTLVVTDRNLGADRIAPSLQVVTRSGDIGNYAFSTQTIPLGAPAVSTDANGNTVYTYTVANLDADGYYTIVCSARDYAGHEVQNIGAETAGGTTETDAVHFSVNREGSVFWIETEHTDKYASGDDRIKYNALQDAYANDVVTVALHEVNVDRVDAFDAEEMQTVLTLNDGSQSEDITLVEGDNYQKNTSVGAGGWYESVYTLDNENFDHDGYYSMSIITYDMAGNSNVNQSQESGVLRFTLDRTNPIISTNVEQENAIINADSFPVEIRLTEANVEEISVLLNDGEVTAEDLGDNTYQVVVDAGSAQTLQIRAKDKAGNESTYDIVDLTVSTNPFVRFYANKPLFWGSIAGVVVLTGFVLFLVLWKRRKKEEQE